MFSRPTFSLLFLILLVASATVYAFSPVQHIGAPSRGGEMRENTSPSTFLKVLWDPKNTDSDLVDFPTPAQSTALRKESKKRQARRQLATYFIPQEETLGPLSEQTLQEIWDLLNQHELIQIRGICRDERRFVHNTALRICLDLEMMQSDQDTVLPVAMLSTKGHSAILYSPTLDLDHPDKFPLRTSVGQKNTWTARIKPPRDHRGQIIREEPKE